MSSTKPANCGVGLALEGDCNQSFNPLGAGLSPKKQRQRTIACNNAHGFDWLMRHAGQASVLWRSGQHKTAVRSATGDGPFPRNPIPAKRIRLPSRILPSCHLTGRRFPPTLI